ncbi:alpha/beta hydrolase [Streptosporangium sp. NPDC051023]|uniref:alpha/beta hydrolase n=1 Tax=Streptosporangium sp. NPDC051023 TaxID=3155410 RepID=UPI00344F21BC
MTSTQARLTAVMVRLMGVKRRMYGSAEKVHKTIAADRRKGPALPDFKDRLSVEERRVDGHRVYTVSPKAGLTGRHLLYLHGGGWSLSITSLHWDLIGTLAERLGCSITVPLYPLAPEHTARDVWAMLLPLYRHLVERFSPESLTVMGDSAGGNLALSLVMQARRAGLPQPAHLVLVSPCADISVSDPAMVALERTDPILSIQGVREFGRLYAGDLGPRDPVVSPLYGSLRELAPIALFSGTREILNADAHRLRDKARQEGVSMEWFEYPGMMHVWPLYPLPESRRAVEEIIAIVEGPRA